MLIDIARTVGLDTLTFPGDPPARIERVATIGQGSNHNATALSMSCHCGTHVDAPLHFAAGGRSLDQFPLERLICTAHVVEAAWVGVIPAELLDGLALAPGEAVLFKTLNSDLPRDAYRDQVAWLGLSAAQRLVEHGASLVGIDYLSIEVDALGLYPVHRLLLGADVLILEDIDLRAVAPGRCRLYCLPVKLHGTEAAPCRAVLETLD
jgi:arylformamidase